MNLTIAKENRKVAQERGEVFYEGKVCRHHPELEGKHYTKNQDCPGCHKAAVQRTRGTLTPIQQEIAQAEKTLAALKEQIKEKFKEEIKLERLDKAIAAAKKRLEAACSVRTHNAEGRCIGEYHPFAKLSDEAVRRIKACVAEGASYRKAAAEFGISFAHVRSLVKGTRRAQ